MATAAVNSAAVCRCGSEKNTTDLNQEEQEVHPGASEEVGNRGPEDASQTIEDRDHADNSGGGDRRKPDQLLRHRRGLADDHDARPKH